MTLRCNGEVTAEVGITAFHPPLLHGFITSCKILSYPISQYFLQSPGRIIPRWFLIEEMMKRWMESFTTISGRGWSQGFGATFEDGDLGRDPEHDNKLKNGVGDVLALWDI